MAKYVKTDAPTAKVQSKTKNRVNVTGTTVIIASKHKGKWLSSPDILKEFAKDRISVQPAALAKALRVLSGNCPRTIPAYQRNELIRRPLTQVERESGKYRGCFKYKYKFNVKGTMRIKPALGFTRIDNITKARYIAYKIKPKSE